MKLAVVLGTLLLTARTVCAVRRRKRTRRRVKHCPAAMSAAFSSVLRLCTAVRMLEQEKSAAEGSWYYDCFHPHFLPRAPETWLSFVFSVVLVTGAIFPTPIRDFSFRLFITYARKLMYMSINGGFLVFLRARM